jgi:hypothetical protein
MLTNGMPENYTTDIMQYKLDLIFKDDEKDIQR